MPNLEEIKRILADLALMQEVNKQN